MDRTHRCQAAGSRQRMASNCCQQSINGNQESSGPDRPRAISMAITLDSSVGNHSTNQRRKQCDRRTTRGVSEDSTYLLEQV
ncbi:hypothetical protein CTAM01_12181 [Colletotrichum tamarilloi]|uniref:Uncharacterized protein n=1 Tax=Colletotrichum tamarilloi TaxID=1209934 RepID=A0ABQ9QVJ6_9PEZI|nr:uncharacterized protein CTAM01_12181 [Colletotrichum tamarilloi]KAK1486456.1 hypothetical protein CTAM01_12181 [Colletotrichum tamarilloi]